MFCKLESRNGMIVKGEQFLLLWPTLNHKRLKMQPCINQKRSHSTAYRKIRWLVKSCLQLIKSKLLKLVRNQVYSGAAKRFKVKYEHNNVVIEAEQNSETLRKITESFFTLPDLDSLFDIIYFTPGLQSSFFCFFVNNRT